MLRYQVRESRAGSTVRFVLLLGAFLFFGFVLTVMIAIACFAENVSLVCPIVFVLGIEGILLVGLASSLYNMITGRGPASHVIVEDETNSR